MAKEAYPMSKAHREQGVQYNIIIYLYKYTVHY